MLLPKGSLLIKTTLFLEIHAALCLGLMVQRQFNIVSKAESTQIVLGVGIYKMKIIYWLQIYIEGKVVIHNKR